MGRENRLASIAWELKNLWECFTRKELSDYFNVSERTLYTYSKQLKLPKKIDKNVTVPQGNEVSLWIYNKDSKKYKKTTFTDWNKFAVWTKAQSHPIQIGSMERDGHTYITCKHGEQEYKEAKEYREKCIK